MPSSDIYQIKESPLAKKDDSPSSARRRRSSKGFDEATNPDLARTHSRRSRNRGARRFRHQMKKPEYSKKFWIRALSVGVAILVVLVVWDLLFRYPDPEPDYPEDVYPLEVE